MGLVSVFFFFGQVQHLSFFSFFVVCLQVQKENIKKETKKNIDSAKYFDPGYEFYT